MLDVTICAVGRLRTGPERALVDDYVARFARTGRRVGLGYAGEQEIDERKVTGGPALFDAFERASPARNSRVALDERGRAMTSVAFADWLAQCRDAGHSGVAFWIGAAEGFPDDVSSRCDLTLSIGPMVWPHMLVRVMLAEQLYRAASILAGTPYHKA